MPDPFLLRALLAGLGLAIVKGFAEAMGMSVELRTGDAGGLDARLRMPRSSPDGLSP